MLKIISNPREINQSIIDDQHRSPWKPEMKENHVEVHTINLYLSVIGHTGDIPLKLIETSWRLHGIDNRNERSTQSEGNRKIEIEHEALAIIEIRRYFTSKIINRLNRKRRATSTSEKSIGPTAPKSKEAGNRYIFPATASKRKLHRRRK